ncbi:MAG: hypothetical protein ACKN89_06380, partial [Cyanobium sp.]
RHPDVLKDLRQSFTLKEIDAEEARNLADLRTYALVRCLQSPLREILLQADLTPEEVGEFLSTQQQSSGKFLYVEKVLNDLQAKILPLVLGVNYVGGSRQLRWRVAPSSSPCPGRGRKRGEGVHPRCRETSPIWPQGSGVEPQGFDRFPNRQPSWPLVFRDLLPQLLAERMSRRTP